MRALVAVDIREAGPAAVVDAAGDWGARLGATVDVVYAEAVRDVADFIADPYVKQVMEAEARKLQAADQRAIDALVSRLPEGCRGVGLIKNGRPPEVIEQLSADYDVVLVATHGRRGLAHFWLGSIAEQVVRRASCTVVVLRLPASA